MYCLCLCVDVLCASARRSLRGAGVGAQRGVPADVSRRRLPDPAPVMFDCIPVGVLWCGVGDRDLFANKGVRPTVLPSSCHFF